LKGVSPLLGRRHRRPRTEHRRAISISHIDADHAERRDSSHEPALYIRLALTLEPEQRSTLPSPQQDDDKRRRYGFVHLLVCGVMVAT
jgi:hypothetical protein